MKAPPPQSRSPHMRAWIFIPAALAFAALAPLAVFAVVSILAFENALVPLYLERTEIAAASVQRRLEFSIQMFGDLSMLRDVDAVLEEVRAINNEVDFIAVVDTDGAILFRTDIASEPRGGLQGLLTRQEQSAFGALAETADSLFHALLQPRLTPESPEHSRRVDHFLITTSLLQGPSGPAGHVHVGVDVGLFERIRQDVAFDAATLFFAASIIGYECLLLLFVMHITRPRRMLHFLSGRLATGDLRHTVVLESAGGVTALAARVNAFVRDAARRAAALGDRAPPELRFKSNGPGRLSLPAVEYVRLPLFLFFLSEAILRPFLPAYLETLPGDWGSEAQVGAAMAAFMTASIFGVLAGSLAADRWSVRIVFLLGAATCVVGIAGHALLVDALQAVGARSVTGLGYGLVYAAAQVYVAQNAEPKRKAGGFSVFLAVVVSAEISGPAIGGILADRFGFDLAFAAAGGALALSGVAAYWLLPRHGPTAPTVATPQPPSPQQPKNRWFPTGGARFAMLTLCFSMPAKMLLTGGLFLLIPLAVTDAGGQAIDTGRVLMLYGLAILAFGGVLARLADVRRLFGQWTFLGAMISGIGLCLPAFVPTIWGLAAAAAMFGFGQAMTIPSQIAFMLSMTAPHAALYGTGAVLGGFRFFERVGSLLGPVVAAILLMGDTPQGVLFTLGAYSLLAASIGAAYFLIVGEQDEDEAIGELLVET